MARGRAALRNVEHAIEPEDGIRVRHQQLNHKVEAVKRRLRMIPLLLPDRLRRKAHPGPETRAQRQHGRRTQQQQHLGPQPPFPNRSGRCTPRFGTTHANDTTTAGKKAITVIYTPANNITSLSLRLATISSVKTECTLHTTTITNTATTLPNSTFIPCVNPLCHPTPGCNPLTTLLASTKSTINKINTPAAVNTPAASARLALRGARDQAMRRARAATRRQLKMKSRKEKKKWWAGPRRLLRRKRARWVAAETAKRARRTAEMGMSGRGVGRPPRGRWGRGRAGFWGVAVVEVGPGWVLVGVLLRFLFISVSFSLLL
ncbi:hypothetical protein B0I37DRAFT_195032 [Chaetomium sp. MPI-CAGE-AT-0009]|nr:hypothetical protein B0I37DRAFT_195032 [Chaetomium sp. MPI-CAGE-AT-0009]